MASRQGTPTLPRFPSSPTLPPPPRPSSPLIFGVTPTKHPPQTPSPLSLSTQISGATSTKHPLRAPPLVPIPKVPRPMASPSHPSSSPPTLYLANAAVKPQVQKSKHISSLPLPSPQHVRYYNGDHFPREMGFEPHNPKTDMRKQSETFKKQSNIGSLSTVAITHENKGAAISAFVNSNVQGVNNSVLYNSSVTHHHPGVCLSLD